MMNTARHTAESLFRPAAPEGSNAAKLQKIRAREILRMRERGPIERQQRLEKRRTLSRGTLFAPKERTDGDV
ncbi:hypothetical protein predicted by Glimmer/Critica (plasmid) [Sinorhizobium fredii HH103]|uniref:Uncharacterized protein n=1 Tax=Sinorhizobium fredii (strain HH103) TaxID=1117943 RepID=G9AI01_SINF1|nr:hypothetical protein [Sinorhizobium fredii]CCF00683.1 hypothetical protein predicted by Glimmer/Critica [Sinorhizobium fredii HH103]